MKGTFNNIHELATEVQRLEKMKNDFVVGGANMRYGDDNTMILASGLGIGNGGETIGQFKINGHAHGQLAEHFKVDKRYYDRMEQVPGLRAYNMNRWLEREPEAHTIRTYGGAAPVIRAFLSDTFRTFDNMVILEAFLPVVADMAGADGYKNLIQVSSITDRRLYIQVRFPNLEGEIRRGDPVQYGLTITNSEVGVGAVNVEEMIWILSCMNGAVAESLLRRRHVGRSIDPGDEGVRNIYSSETIAADIKTFQLRFRDILKSALTTENFAKQIGRFKTAAEQEITGTVQNVVENVTVRYGFNENERFSILDRVIKSGDLSLWGIAQGATAMSQEIENYDRQYEIERTAATMMVDISPDQWKVIQKQEPPKKRGSNGNGDVRN
jgi:hypothetical protein